MIIKPNSLLEKVTDLYDKGYAKGHITGWPSLDEHFTVKAGEFTVVTGMPSHGKSEWLDNLCVNIAMKHGYRIAVFSPENHPLEVHCRKIIEKLMQQPFFGTNRMTKVDMHDSLALMSRHFAFICPSETEFTPINIITEALPWLDMTRHTRPLAMVIDPWNEMDHYRPAGLSETEYISRVLTELRRAARDYNFHLFLVAHPMKMQKDKDGHYPVPRPYDISGSAHWYNKADNCISIWRDVESSNNLTQIHVQKVRFNSTGTPGMVEFVYNREKSVYTELSYSELLR